MVTTEVHITGALHVVGIQEEVGHSLLRDADPSTAEAWVAQAGIGLRAVSQRL